MTSDPIFNSLDKPIPPVREDLQFIPVQHNGKSLLYVYDVLGYVPRDLALDPQAENLFTLFNGTFSIVNISEIAQNGIDQKDLLDFIRFLDKSCILRSSHFTQELATTEEKFEDKTRRHSALAGNSYPDKPTDLQSFLEDIFYESGGNPVRIPQKALYAPHIDPVIGSNVYSSAFSTLKEISPRRIVILATAHYAGYYSRIYEDFPFIGSEKEFELPNGSLKTDMKYIGRLSDAGKNAGFTLQDRAHRIEHSIELHLLFAQHIWKHNFSIVPILVNTFDELFYMADGQLAKQIDHFSALLQELDDDETFYLISGDLAHVGKKFGDKVPAASMKSDVETFDEQFLKYAASNESDGLLRQTGADYNHYRICGFPPLYTFLKAFPSLRGEQIAYHWWDESERESAVSFGAISY